MIKITGTLRDEKRVYTGSNAAEAITAFLDDTVEQQIETLLKQEQQLQRNNQFPKDKFYVVDGKTVGGAQALKSVKYLGRVESVAKSSEAILLVKIYDEIVALSPFDRGVYRRHNLVLLNGRIIATNAGQLLSYLKQNPLRFNDTLTFANRTPYARRLEYMGVFGSVSSAGNRINKKLTKYKRTSAKITKDITLVSRNTTANGTYYRAANKVKRLFKQFSVKFQFQSAGQLGFKIPINAPTQRTWRTSFSGGSKHKIGRDYLYPTIIIKPIQGTTLA